jgi:Icc-related predicted phosphoesterase
MGDLLIHAGDLTTRGAPHEVADFMQWYQAQPHPNKIVIAGNHDFFFERYTADEVARVIPSNVTYLNDSGITIAGLNIWGSPVSPWFYNWAFNRHPGNDIIRHWQLVPPGTDILITHGPVYGLLDRKAGGNHVGCKDLLRKVEEIKPKLHVCGHIHEGYGLVQHGTTTFVNASVLNEHYRHAHEPVVLEI